MTFGELRRAGAGASPGTPTPTRSAPTTGPSPRSWSASPASSSTCRRWSPRSTSTTGRRGRRPRSSAAAAPYLSSALRRGPTSTSTAAPCRGPRSCAPGGSAASAFVEGCVGEAVGELYVARHFPPQSKAAMDELVANLLEAYRRSITDLDWMTEETKQRAFAKLETFRPKIGYPEKFRDYSSDRGRPRRPDRTTPTARRRSSTTASWRRSAHRSTATSGSCCRRRSTPTTTPAPTRSASPPAILQRPFFDARGRPGGELRRHRRGDRPRDRSRLRRPGLGVRRARQPQRVVDRRRQAGLQASARTSWSRSTTGSARATCPARRSTGR